MAERLLFVVGFGLLYLLVVLTVRSVIKRIADGGGPIMDEFSLELTAVFWPVSVPILLARKLLLKTAERLALFVYNTFVISLPKKRVVEDREP